MSTPVSLSLLICDQGLRHALVEQLALETQWTVATEFDAASPTLAQEPDLVLADEGARPVAASLREMGLCCPFLLLTPHPPQDDIFDEHVTMPFRMAFLLGRLRAWLKPAFLDAPPVSLGPYTFYPATKLLVRSEGASLKLTEKESAILVFLHRARQPVSRDKLLQEVWGYHAQADTHTLETHIYRLRQKIEPDPAQAQLLLSEAGCYRLVSQITK